MDDCPFCNYTGDARGKVVLENEYCIYIQFIDYPLEGAGMIIPKEHRETVFDLSREEWDATYLLLKEAKLLIDKEYKPDGYNVGWNVGLVGGQEVFHAHLHLAPRYENELYAGRGMNYWIKRPENVRTQVEAAAMHPNKGSGDARKIYMTPVGFSEQEEEIKMIHKVLLNSVIENHEVPDLRQSLGWERRDSDYPALFKHCLFWAGVRDENNRLIAFGCIVGPGIEHGYMEDIMVHSGYQGRGIGSALVKKLLQEAEEQGISIVTVTFDESNWEFYERGGFTPCPGGVWRRK
jgi:diadenosine tetraphosphate (Ap4A) HIT family hydrolase/GNAT superfamily N-acetyltransferase